MIQDSINQMLATAAIGTKLASSGIEYSRGVKMDQLQNEKAKAMSQLNPNTPEAMLDPQGKIERAEAIQEKINKLGNKKIFPSAKLQQQAFASKGETEQGVTNFLEGFSPEGRQAFGLKTPSEIRAEQEAQKAQEAQRNALIRIQNRAEQINRFKQHKGFIGGYRDEAMGGR